MPLTAKEKALVDRILNEEIQWRVQRWIALLMVFAIPVLGYALSGLLGEMFAFACYVITPWLFIDVVRGWRGNATNALVMELAKRFDESKDDG